MNDRNASGVAALLRSMAASEVGDTSIPDVLLHAAEDALFARLALAPPTVVAARALKNFQDAGPVDASDEAAHSDWQAALTVVIDWFVMDAEEALHDGCGEFRSACGRILAVQRRPGI